MALAWKVSWEQSLKGSNPLSSATKVKIRKESYCITMNEVPNYSIVITSINKPTIGVKEIIKNSQKLGFKVYVIGDKKTPREYKKIKDFISITDQKKLNFSICKILPLNTYSRKMIGYLIASQDNVTHIKETDDDNIPFEDFYQSTKKDTKVISFSTKGKFINPLKFFCNDLIWPRGFPLDEILSDYVIKNKKMMNLKQKYIEQNLAELDPDVDSIYRLTNRNKNKNIFTNKIPVLIPKKVYAPFNSQCTTWPIEILPLMYLPSTCSFRMTDIWRSYIAQRLMRKVGFRLIYTKPKVKQIRNEHNLMSDFEQEIEGFLGVKEFIRTIDTFKPKNGMENLNRNLLDIYKTLVKGGFFDPKEMQYLKAWLKDTERVSRKR